MLGRLFIVCCLLYTTFIHASDLEKEQRWASQIEDSLIDGDAIFLDADEQEFLAIYTEAPASERAVIIVHGLGIHPDWQQVIYPLRTGLADRDWHTLSIQAPVLENGADPDRYASLYEEIKPRIDAAVNYIVGLGIHDIALVGHSMGASMSAYYLASGGHSIKAFVGIGMAAGARDKRMNDAFSLAQIHIPVLDLYGQFDLKGVLKTAGIKAKSVKLSHNTDYKQVKVLGANHFFEGKDEELVNTVDVWLNSVIGH